MKKYVLTGGPCTGKTTTIKLLSNYGYETVQEAASILVEEELKKQCDPLWIQDAIAFQRKLILKQLEFESQITSENIAFIDRGIIDTIAYCKIYKAKASKEFYKMAEQNRYEKVFILNFLESYSKSSIRKESKEKAIEIQSTILKTYKEFGYDPIVIPKSEAKERANFILSKVNYLKQDKTFLHVCNPEFISRPRH